ncbi:MAG TPA: hypothetical protein VMV18_01660, partial [bacterium]|nr:hypothetical protein [bacterium]
AAGTDGWTGPNLLAYRGPGVAIDGIFAKANDADTCPPGPELCISAVGLVDGIPLSWEIGPRGVVPVRSPTTVRLSDVVWLVLAMALAGAAITAGDLVFARKLSLPS